MSPGSTPELAQHVRDLILQRGASSLADLRGQLLDVRAGVAHLPQGMRWREAAVGESRYQVFRPQVSASWPELGLYDPATGAGITDNVPAEIGDAIDDLTDIADDFGRALHLAKEDPIGAQDWLRFKLDVHWGKHVEDLVRHLDRCIRRP